MMQKEEPTLPFDVTFCRRTRWSRVQNICGRIQEAWLLAALNFNQRARSASTEETGEQARAETEEGLVTPLVNTVFNAF